MKTPREKYCNDSQYKCHVDMLVAGIIDCNYTPSELREMAIFASIIYEEQNIRRTLNYNNIYDLVKALKVLEDFTNKEENK